MTKWISILLLVLGIIVFIPGVLQVLTGKNLFAKKAYGMYTGASLRHYAHTTGRDMLIAALGFIQTAIDGFSGKEVYVSFGLVMIVLGVLLMLYSKRVLIKK